MSLRRHKDVVERGANLAQYRLYQVDVADLRAKLEENVKREDTKKLMLVKDWLAVGELPRLDQDSFYKIRKECAPTARWITQHETIEHWIHSDVPKCPVVWMYGTPGAGLYFHYSSGATLMSSRQNDTSIGHRRRVQGQI
jgi:hypothetical protein